MSFQKIIFLFWKHCQTTGRIPIWLQPTTLNLIWILRPIAARRITFMLTHTFIIVSPCHLWVNITFRQPHCVILAASPSTESQFIKIQLIPFPLIITWHFRLFHYGIKFHRAPPSGSEFRSKSSSSLRRRRRRRHCSSLRRCLVILNPRKALVLLVLLEEEEKHELSLSTEPREFTLPRSHPPPCTTVIGFSQVFIIYDDDDGSVRCDVDWYDIPGMTTNNDDDDELFAQQPDGRMDYGIYRSRRRSQKLDIERGP